jgi:hypothetical protein
MALQWLLLGSTVVAVGATGCLGSVKGNGHAQTETRALTGFTKISNDTSFDVDIAQGDHFDVLVTTDDNLLPLVLTTVEGETLRIHADKPYSTAAQSTVRVALPSLRGVASAGSGDVTIHGISGGTALELELAGSGALSFDGTAGDLDVSISGSGTATLRGKSAKLALNVSGSGAVDAVGLLATGASVAITGSGTASLNVNGDAKINDQGSGNVRATVNGGVVDVNLLGSGTVEWSGTAREGKTNKLGSGRVVHREK